MIYYVNTFEFIKLTEVEYERGGRSHLFGR